MVQELEKRAKHEVEHTAAEQLIEAGNAYNPDVDIYVSDDKISLRVDMPGVSKGDVKIEVDENNTLIIRGKNSFKENDNIIFRQYRVGDYYRAFQISHDYDKDKITARLENGLLEVVVPKKEEAKPRRIQINA